MAGWREICRPSLYTPISTQCQFVKLLQTFNAFNDRAGCVANSRQTALRARWLKHHEVNHSLGFVASGNVMIKESLMGGCLVI